MHRTLRRKMETSPLMDQAGYMRALEEAYIMALRNVGQGL